MPWKVCSKFFLSIKNSQIIFCRFEAALMGYEIQSFMKEKGLNPLKNPMVPLIQVITYSYEIVIINTFHIDFFSLQAPVFMSFFFA
jgi:hypothetical protein